MTLTIVTGDPSLMKGAQASDARREEALRLLMKEVVSRIPQEFYRVVDGMSEERRLYIFTLASSYMTSAIFDLLAKIPEKDPVVDDGGRHGS